MFILKFSNGETIVCSTEFIRLWLNDYHKLGVALLDITSLARKAN
jgi:hypothetical protein